MGGSRPLSNRIHHVAEDLPAWIGLVPKEGSTGGKERPGHISKAGDKYLRSLLMIGAFSLIKRAKLGGGTRRVRLLELMARRPRRHETPLGTTRVHDVGKGNRRIMHPAGHAGD